MNPFSIFKRSRAARPSYAYDEYPEPPDDVEEAFVQGMRDAGCTRIEITHDNAEPLFRAWALTFPVANGGGGTTSMTEGSPALSTSLAHLRDLTAAADQSFRLRVHGRVQVTGLRLTDTDPVYYARQAHNLGWKLALLARSQLDS